MKKYAKICNQETKQVLVGIGDNTLYYQNQGFELMDVEQAYNGAWYIKGYAPEKPAPTYDEIKEMRALAYQNKVDPITSHISRLRDAEQTEEIVAEIAELIAERDAKVLEIKERLPYLDEQGEE